MTMLFFLKKKKSKFNWILVSYSVDTCYYSDFFISTFIFYSSVLPVSCNEFWNILQFVYIFNSCTYSFPNVKECRVYDCTYLKRMQEARPILSAQAREAVCPVALCPLVSALGYCMVLRPASSEMDHVLPPIIHLFPRPPPILWDGRTSAPKLQE